MQAASAQWPKRMMGLQTETSDSCVASGIKDNELFDPYFLVGTGASVTGWK